MPMTASKIVRPLGNIIIGVPVKPDDDQQSRGGIVLPNPQEPDQMTGKMRDVPFLPNRLKILSCGPDVKNQAFQPGMQVVFDPYRVVTFPVDAEPYVAINEDGILAVIEYASNDSPSC